MNFTGFQEGDQNQLDSLGISQNQVLRQLEQFADGFAFANLDRPCIPGDGIRVLAEGEIDRLVHFFEQEQSRRTLLKFVPASGAATRMFKALHNLAAGHQDETAGKRLLTDFHRFAFARALAKERSDLQAVILSGDAGHLSHLILEKDGLGYGDLPKALIPFHIYGDTARTSLEEHLVEGAMYARDNLGKVRLHLTLSPQHLELVDRLLDEKLADYEAHFGVKYEIEKSVQESSTQTLAVDLENQPIRDAQGRLVFRPAGHGALLVNLARCEADVVFVKNIDNVVPDDFKGETVRYKKALAGYLLQLQVQVHQWLKRLDDGTVSPWEQTELKGFLSREFGYEFEPGSEGTENLRALLDRPIRVCGMVKNEGEPGGGPFWVRNSAGTVSPQIVEKAQVDPNHAQQQELLGGSTHFNPVDLVCSWRNHEGEAYHLPDFSDPETGFISAKSMQGKDIKALELPGLWNGAMAHWNTVFVEVPLVTFNPVKTVFDLLKEKHQPKST